MRRINVGTSECGDLGRDKRVYWYNRRPFHEAYNDDNGVRGPRAVCRKGRPKTRDEPCQTASLMPSSQHVVESLASERTFIAEMVKASLVGLAQI